MRHHSDSNVPLYLGFKREVSQSFSLSQKTCLLKNNTAAHHVQLLDLAEPLDPAIKQLSQACSLHTRTLYMPHLSRPAIVTPGGSPTGCLFLSTYYKVRAFLRRHSTHRKRKRTPTRISGRLERASTPLSTAVNNEKVATGSRCNNKWHNETSIPPAAIPLKPAGHNFTTMDKRRRAQALQEPLAATDCATRDRQNKKTAHKNSARNKRQTPLQARV